MAEVSGGLLLGGVLLMMVLCLWQITPEYFTEMTEASVLQGKEVLKSCYGILAAFSGIGLLPFLLKDVEKRGTAGKPVVLLSLIHIYNRTSFVYGSPYHVRLP